MLVDKLDFNNVFNSEFERDDDVPMRQMLIRLPEPGREVLSALSRLSGQTPIEFINEALWTEVARRMNEDTEEHSLVSAILEANGLTVDQSGIINRA